MKTYRLPLQVLDAVATAAAVAADCCRAPDGSAPALPRKDEHELDRRRRIILAALSEIAKAPIEREER